MAHTASRPPTAPGVRMRSTYGVEGIRTTVPRTHHNVPHSCLAFSREIDRLAAPRPVCPIARSSGMIDRAPSLPPLPSGLISRQFPGFRARAPPRRRYVSNTRIRGSSLDLRARDGSKIEGKSVDDRRRCSREEEARTQFPCEQIRHVFCEDYRVASLIFP